MTKKRKIKTKSLIIIILASILTVVVAVVLVFFAIDKINSDNVKIKFIDNKSMIEVFNEIDFSRIIVSSSGVVTYPKVDTNTLGEYPAVFMVTNTNGYKKSFVHTIHVVDTKAPVINLNSSVIIVKDLTIDVADNINGSSMDNYDGLVTTECAGTIGDTPGIYQITYSAIDSSGNKGSKTAYYLYDLTPENMTACFMIANIVMANKKIPLPIDYSPGRNGDADLMLRNMMNAAKEQGYALIESCAFTSYKEQESLYALQVLTTSAYELDKYVAKPGYNEHQTGLAFDIDDGSTDFSKSPAYQWLLDNCAEYGFILRYPKGKEATTGYAFEPEHYRYVGIDVARLIMSNNLTLEQYLQLEN